jgi:hypothetical protein
MRHKRSSILWLNSKYARAKGQIDRQTSLIEDLERRLEYHQRHAQKYETELVDLRVELAESQSQAAMLSHAIELHGQDGSIEFVPPIRPHENPPFFKYGGMTKAIFNALKSAPEEGLSTVELRDHLVQRLGLAPEAASRFRRRLHTRLEKLLVDGKVTSIEANFMSGRRWMLSKEWQASPPEIRSEKRERHRTQGDGQSARWLIQSQLDISSIQNMNSTAEDSSLASTLDKDMSSISAVWMLHPMYFEVDHEKEGPRRKSHQSKLRHRIIESLAMINTWTTLADLQASFPCPANYKRRSSIRSIEMALKHLVLEGRVERRQREIDGQVEWRLR